MHTDLLASTLFAQNQGAPTGGIPTDWILIGGVGFLLMWLIVLRPAQRKDRERKNALTKIRKGDRVVVAGGIYGTVHSTEVTPVDAPGLTEPAVIVRIDDKTKIVVLKSSIYQILGEPAPEPKKEQASSTA